MPSVGRLLEMPRPAGSDPELNPQQQSAVSHDRGPLLVVAGAGTGKTRVITERIRRLLAADPDLPAESILGLTFTDKAAGEMKHRVVVAAGERGKDVWLSTFHDFCLKRIIRELNPGVQLLDEYDHWILLRRNLPLLQLSYFRRIAEPGQFLGDFCDFFSRCQDELVSPDDYDAYVRREEESFQRQREQLDDELRANWTEKITREKELARAYRASDQLLRERNCCTFGMIIMDTVEQLRRNADLRERLRADYRYILVDEFQDTNIAQIELLWLLAGAQGNVMAVGDNDQAIYRFRGASFSSFTLFLERFTGARPTPGDLGKHFLPLMQNYRSSSRILGVAGQVIAQNEKSEYLPDKRLFTSNAPGDKVQVAEFSTQEEEAAWIGGEIAALHAKGHSWREFAALYRSHANRDLLVKELTQRRIPFVIRNLSILSHPLIRDLMAYLRLIAVPSDDVACARVLAVPAWGMEAQDLARLCERAGRAMPLWEALEASHAEEPFSRNPRLPEVIALVRGLRRRALELTAAELLDALVEALGLVFAPGDATRPYLDTFAKFVREWERKAITESPRLREFVEYLKMFEEAGGLIALPESPVEDAVQLMTVHAAKGLEFDHVFILRMSNGAFPLFERRPVLEFPQELMKEELPQGGFHIQEERRLFYVAMTRARRRLTMTCVTGKRSKPSPFLDDFLQEPSIQRGDVRQLAPRVVPTPAAAPPETGQLNFAAQLFDDAGTQRRVGSRMPRWAQEFRPPPQAPLRISATGIDAHTSCPLRYHFQYGWRIRGRPHAAMTFGSVMHATVKFIVSTVAEKGRVAWADVEMAFDREWRSAGYEDDYQEQQYRAEGLEQLRVFHREYSAAPAKVIAQERNFELPMEGDVVLRGRIDQVNRIDGDEVEIVDYKTGRPKDEKTVRKNLQLSIYAMAARELLEREATRLTFYNLSTNSPVSSTRSDKELAKARAQVAEAADQIRVGYFPAAPTAFKCRNCDFKLICPAHEAAIAAEA